MTCFQLRREPVALRFGMGGKFKSKVEAFITCCVTVWVAYSGILSSKSFAMEPSLGFVHSERTLNECHFTLCSNMQSFVQ